MRTLYSFHSVYFKTSPNDKLFKTLILFVYLFLFILILFSRTYEVARDALELLNLVSQSPSTGVIAMPHHAWFRQC